jgi:hypothetical protein
VACAAVAAPRILLGNRLGALIDYLFCDLGLFFDLLAVANQDRDVLDGLVLGDFFGDFFGDLGLGRRLASGRVRLRSNGHGG